MSHIFFLFLFIFTASNLHFSSAQQEEHVRHSFNISNSPWTPKNNTILLSQNSIFAAGFLEMPDSPALYTFCIWYFNVSKTTVVWSANVAPPLGASATLSISRSGELMLVNSPQTNLNLWPSRPGAEVNKTSLVLSNAGNLVYGPWESFSFPTDTILPNQNINGTNITSRNGKFKFDSKELIQTSTNNVYWSSSSTFITLDDLGVIMLQDGTELVSSNYGVKNLSRRLTLDDDGNLRLYSFHPTRKQWITTWQAKFQLCEIPSTCGQNSICLFHPLNESTSCVCPPGYRAGSGNSCELKIPLRDLRKTKFLPLDYVNFTGGSNQSDVMVPNFSACRTKCMSNAECLGFMFKYDGTNYCALKLGRMVNGYWSPVTGTVMYLRVNEAEIDKSGFTGMTSLVQTICPVRIKLPEPPEESEANTRFIVIVCSLFAAEVISGAVLFWAFLKKYTNYRDMARTLGLEVMAIGGPKRFRYDELKVATKDFSNPIGKGAFGVVYLGNLSDGRSVAVKSLRQISGGDADFWTEVTIIARMHHLNLVRLWGFCAEKGRRILVYEYIPNGSLNEFLFQKVERVEGVVSSLEPNGKPILDWNVRYRIALGVARAIAYLHEECLEWVLHCDIKPENILLTEDFCPKVSDFGLAKLKKKEDIISMSRVRGTPGYMAPEWTRSEPITAKADVYSFGLVLLEIVSGERNFTQLDSKVESDQWFFPGWAFDKVFKEMNVEDILDRVIIDSYDKRLHFDMINRMVKTAMWCLQDRPEVRPSMGKVAKMLEGTVEITEPKRPTIYYLRDD